MQFLKKITIRRIAIAVLTVLFTALIAPILVLAFAQPKVVKYDCSMTEISVDIPAAVKKQCREKK
jgi:hypothetical protein